MCHKKLCNEAYSALAKTSTKERPKSSSEIEVDNNPLRVAGEIL